MKCNFQEDPQILIRSWKFCRYTGSESLFAAPDTMINQTPDFQHKEYPRQFAKNEFWKQIKRTVNGKPVSEREIGMIVDQVSRLLELDARDHLLDLGCGNGALAGRLFSSIESYTGVDFSGYLLGIAREFFSGGDGFEYLECDIRDVNSYIDAAGTVSKVLIYGCVSYLSKRDTEVLLTNLANRLPALETILIGNIPQRTYAVEFFASRSVLDYDLDDPHSPIGVWWNPEELVAIAKNLGLNPSCHRMPRQFYGNRYRFDMRLQKP